MITLLYLEMHYNTPDLLCTKTGGVYDCLALLRNALQYTIFAMQENWLFVGSCSVGQETNMLFWLVSLASSCIAPFLFSVSLYVSEKVLEILTYLYSIFFIALSVEDWVFSFVVAHYVFPSFSSAWSWLSFHHSCLVKINQILWLKSYCYEHQNNNLN